MSEKNTHNEMTANDVNVVTTSIGPNQFEIVATATFSSNPSEIWALLWDWEQLLAVGLPGMTDNFQWLSGGPDEIPSTFQFEIGGVTIKEEIYERTMEHRYYLRYRTLEPALGILDYEAVIELDPIDEKHTAFSATREVKLEPGVEPEMLAEIVQSETQNLKEYFTG